MNLTMWTIYRIQGPIRNTLMNHLPTKDTPTITMTTTTNQDINNDILTNRLHAPNMLILMLLMDYILNMIMEGTIPIRLIRLTLHTTSLTTMLTLVLPKLLSFSMVRVILYHNRPIVTLNMLMTIKVILSNSGRTNTHVLFTITNGTIVRVPCRRPRVITQGRMLPPFSSYRLLAISFHLLRLRPRNRRLISRNITRIHLIRILRRMRRLIPRLRRMIISTSPILQNRIIARFQRNSLTGPHGVYRVGSPSSGRNCLFNSPPTAQLPQLSTVLGTVLHATVYPIPLVHDHVISYHSNAGNELAQICLFEATT